MYRCLLLIYFCFYDFLLNLFFPFSSFPPNSILTQCAFHLLFLLHLQHTWLLLLPLMTNGLVLDKLETSLLFASPLILGLTSFASSCSHVPDQDSPWEAGKVVLLTIASFVEVIIDNPIFSSHVNCERVSPSLLTLHGHQQATTFSYIGAVRRGCWSVTSTINVSFENGDLSQEGRLNWLFKTFSKA